jgi:flagellin
MTAQRQLTGSQGDLSTSLSRLSSGLRINSARDDAAGLAISERFRAQITGLNQGIRNANDGISLAQTAEGALSEVTSNLQRIRELAVQSANATNSAADRTTLQTEVSQLIAEIDRVATQTKFNNIALLDGSFTAQTFQVGANSGETISISSIVSARTASLGSNTLSFNNLNQIIAATATTTIPASDVVTQTLTIGSASGGTGTVSVTAGQSAAEIAASINAASSSSGLGITATASNVAYISGFAAGDVTFTLKSDDAEGGVAYEGTADIAATITATDLTALINDINDNYGATGITAEAATVAGTVGIKLTDVDGDDIVLQTFTTTNTTTTTMGVGLTTGAATQTLTEGVTDGSRIVGQVVLSSSKGAASATSDNGVTVLDGAETNSSNSLASLSISTSSSATAALATIDAALDTVNSGRGDLGAYQNRFESVVASLAVTAENLSASRSRIVDADFAAETAALTKAQILQQSGIAILAQANARPHNVMALLQ